MGRRRRISRQIVDMDPQSRADGQAALGRRDPEALDHMRGVTCESV